VQRRPADHAEVTPVKRALIFQHMDHDHPGRFADFFAEDGILPEPVRLFEGEAIPNLTDFDLLFVLGGAQDTWQEDEYPYLAAEKQAIREWVWDRAKPYFGICLGHQLLATALGGEVKPAAVSEIGVFKVELTGGGQRHAFLKGIEPTQSVMQWHHAEVARPPQGADVLAASAAAQVQALAIGAHACSTQFHCEFTPQSVAGWRSMPGYTAALEREHGQGAYDRLRRQCLPLMPEMAANTRRLWDNFKTASGLVR
jgi:GMP synthase-like glutamine amidotransferase